VKSVRFRIAITVVNSSIFLETLCWTFSRPMAGWGRWERCQFLDSEEESQDDWHSSSRTPDFFVVDDDMYDMSVRVEAPCSLAKGVLLEELAMLLRQFEEWCVYLALIKGGL
jgi:hypothetical protein